MSIDSYQPTFNVYNNPEWLNELFSGKPQFDSDQEGSTNSPLENKSRINRSINKTNDVSQNTSHFWATEEQSLLKKTIRKIPRHNNGRYNWIEITKSFNTKTPYAERTRQGVREYARRNFL